MMDNFLIITYQLWSLPKQGKNKWYWAAPGEIKQIFDQLPKATTFAGVVFADLPTDEDLVTLTPVVDAWRVIAWPKVHPQSPTGYRFWRQKLVQTHSPMAPSETVAWLTTHFFGPQEGNKLDVRSFQVNPWYHGKISYQGTVWLTLTADFGPTFRPVGNFVYSLYEYRQLEIWPEFRTTGDVEVQMVVYELTAGENDQAAFQQTYSQVDLQKEIVIPARTPGGQLAVSFAVRGKGSFALGDIHFRWTRRGSGKLLPGGQRIVNPDRGELHWYFNPGNLKPPLNVYFSGYRTREGFEGFYMMKGLHHPFILITDPRLEGGGFYLQSPETEKQICQKICTILAWLGFSNQEITFAGLSMGTAGALYYGSFFKPHAIVLGKPLMRLGQVAKNERARFNTFATSLDVARLFEDQTGPYPDDEVLTSALDQRLAKRLAQADLTQTKLIVAYMNQDDYDELGFATLVGYLNQQKHFPYLIRRGFEGHHVDQPAAANGWFIH